MMPQKIQPIKSRVSELKDTSKNRKKQYEANRILNSLKISCKLLYFSIKGLFTEMYEMCSIVNIMWIISCKMGAEVSSTTVIT